MYKDSTWNHLHVRDNLSKQTPYWLACESIHYFWTSIRQIVQLEDRCAITFLSNRSFGFHLSDDKTSEKNLTELHQRKDPSNHPEYPSNRIATHYKTLN